ncbi:hypothetical protein MHUMG1_02168 [Metarhizium humberi]|uniref:Uncharacterized protein n=1 Tax=Metarhizium humberi TaxID=2596975 RepID=A0A9P8MDB0_9HYPO|nr:hypothetical protein MHUMG1_02168 [Metarhizium humberi]
MSCRHVAGRGAAPCHAPSIATTLDGAESRRTEYVYWGQPSQGRRDTAPRRPCAQWHPTGVVMLSVPIPADHPVSYIHTNSTAPSTNVHRIDAIDGRRDPLEWTLAASADAGTTQTAGLRPSWKGRDVKVQTDADAPHRSTHILLLVRRGTRAAIIPTARPPPPPPQGLESGLAAATLTRESYEVAMGVPDESLALDLDGTSRLAVLDGTSRSRLAQTASLYSVEMGDRMLLQAVDVGSGWGPSDHPILRPS